MAHDWKTPLWQQLAGRAAEGAGKVRFSAYFRGRRKRAVELLLIGDVPRVRVTEAMIQRLEAIAASGYAAHLKGRAAQRAWKNAAARVREHRGATVSLNAYGMAICMPTYHPRRRSCSLSVYEAFTVDPDELAEWLDPAQLAVARALKRERRRLLRIGELGRLLFPDPEADADDEEWDDTLPDWAPEEIEEPEEIESAWARHRNVIFFGPPGTGKSYALASIVEDHLAARRDHILRVTFHPEYSYFDFVGAYRPAVGWLKTMARFEDADGRAREAEPRTYYRFEPGPLSRALALAAANPERPVALVIEEINRGNCAAIFGDVFQLLDRAADAEDPDAVGWSEYAVHPSREWAGWLDGAISRLSDVYDRSTGALKLPPNLYLYATMNTSDQSLYPMDVAFRRRWGMEYRGVDASGDLRARVPLHAADAEGAPWLAVMRALNEAIVDFTHSDDKVVGPWFVRPTPGRALVDTVEFKSKVLFYLWGEVFRGEPARVFEPGLRTYGELVARYDAGEAVFNAALLARIG